MKPNLCLVECKTNLGYDCNFPFYYKGIYHSGCITHDNILGAGNPYCGIDIDGVKYIDVCLSGCPGNCVLIIQSDDNDNQPLFS